jgi:hypothetical protein
MSTCLPCFTQGSALVGKIQTDYPPVQKMTSTQPNGESVLPGRTTIHTAIRKCLEFQTIAPKGDQNNKVKLGKKELPNSQNKSKFKEAVAHTTQVSGTRPYNFVVVSLRRLPGAIEEGMLVRADKQAGNRIHAPWPLGNRDWGVEPVELPTWTLVATAAVKLQKTQFEFKEHVSHPASLKTTLFAIDQHSLPALANCLCVQVPQAVHDQLAFLLLCVWVNIPSLVDNGPQG